MSNLLELAIDLINDAKGGKDAQAKLYLLEQVKEIVFHRDKSLLKDIIPSILDFMVEKAIPIRKYLIKFADEAMTQDAQLAFPYFLNLFNFLVSDSTDVILALLAKSYQKYYDKLLLCIVAMPIVPKAQGLSDPKKLWQILSSLTTGFEGYIASNKSDTVKSSCLRLYESMILFGMPSVVAVANADPRLAARKDPRLARAAAAAAGSASVASSTAQNSAKSSDDIPLHHPFISRNEIQGTAEENFTKALLWFSKGGAHNHPFSPALMSVLGQVIANVAASKLKHATTAAKALLSMLQGKSQVCQEMSGGDRQNLARALHHLLRSAGAYTADPEGIMPKLRTAVAAVEALGLDVSTADSNSQASLLTKRGRGAAVGAAAASTEGDEEDSEAQIEQRRSSAVAAIDAAELKMKSSLSGFSGLGALDGDDDGADAISMLLAKVSSTKAATSKANFGIGGVLISGDNTELSKELAVLEDPASLNDIKLVVTSQQAGSKAGKTDNSITQTPLAPTTDAYADLALCSIRKLLVNYSSIDVSNSKMLAPFSLMCVKMIVSMVISDVDAGKALVPVQIVSIIPSASAGRLSEDVPAHVMLPRVLWAFLGFVLTPRYDVGESAASGEFEEELQKKVAVLSHICQALHEELQWEAELDHERREEGTFIEEESMLADLQAIYNALCVASLSRLIQISRLRSSLAAFMLGLPVIPTACISILKLLIGTGTKGVQAPPVPPGRDRGGAAAAAAAEAARNRGTRVESLQLIGQMVFSQDESAGRASLNHLLYSSLSEDFELRTKVINLIVHEIMHIEDWCDDIVAAFALQAMIGVLGIENVAEWCQRQPAPVSQTDIATVGEEPPYAAADDEAMEVEDEEAQETREVREGEVGRDSVPVSAPPPNCRSLVVAFQQYQSAEGETAMHLPVVGETERESYAKRAVQLLSQLCLVDLPLLAGFVDLHSVWAMSANPALGSSVKSDGDKRKVDISDKEDADTSDVKEDTPADIETSGAVSWSLPDTLREELRNILPAISQRNTFEAIFDTLSERCDRASWPLLEYALSVLLNDLNVPASLALIQRVRSFVLRSGAATRNEAPSPAVEEVDSGASGEEKTEMVVEGKEPAETSSLTMRDLQDTDAFTLMLPLIGGMSSAEVEAVLPRIVGLFEDNAKGLKEVFGRITRARPPPLSKAALLVALHKIDFIAENLKPKSLLDAISVCLNNKSEFSGEVIKEALKTMLLEEVPPNALMRTAILSAQAFGEVKRYVLSDVIPHLVRKRVWVTAPKLWDGVLYGAKHLATKDNKNSELTLRALLGVPAEQLKDVLKAAPDVKVVMGMLLKTLSAEERGEVVSGKWAGLLDEGGAVEASALSEEKQTLINDISATATI